MSCPVMYIFLNEEPKHVILQNKHFFFTLQFKILNEPLLVI